MPKGFREALGTVRQSRVITGSHCRTMILAKSSHIGAGVRLERESFTVGSGLDPGGAYLGTRRRARFAKGYTTSCKSVLNSSVR